MSFAFIVEKLAAFFAGPIGRWIVVAALGAAALFAGGVYERSIGYREGLKAGDQRVAEQAKANAQAIIALNAKYRGEEAAHKADVERLNAEHSKDLTDARMQANEAVAAARAGRIRLSIPATPASPDDCHLSGAGADSPGAPEPRRTELPAETSANLLATGADADEVVRKLNWCEDLLVADRKLKGTQ